MNFDELPKGVRIIGSAVIRGIKDGKLDLSIHLDRAAADQAVVRTGGILAPIYIDIPAGFTATEDDE